MNKYKFIPTNIQALDHLFCGGFRMPCVVEAYGRKTSWKSGLLYTAAGSFQKQFTKGDLALIDFEGAIKADHSRLPIVYGWDMSRVEIYPNKDNPVRSLEESFALIIRLIKNQSEKRELCIMFDTPAAALPESEINQIDLVAKGEKGKKNPGGLHERNRVIKAELSKIVSLISQEGKDVALLMPNQVYITVDKMGNKSIVNCGGEGWGHLAHYSLLMKHIKDESFDEDDSNITIEDAQYSHKQISVMKSRYSPLVKKIPIVINTADGGRLDVERTLVETGIGYGFLYQPTKGWWTIKGDAVSKKVRKRDIYENQEMLEKISNMIKERYLKNFLMVRETYADMEKHNLIAK